MALRQILCVSMLVAATPAPAADDEGEQSGNGGSYYHCEGVALPQ